MGRDMRFQRTSKDRVEGIHPVWRGIGFLLMGLIAVMSYAGANLLVDANKARGWVEVPDALQGGLSWAPDLYAEIVVGIFLALIGFGVLTIAYSFVYQLTRPKSIFED